MAIPKIYKYGIKITKPWSSEMYDFNENLRAYYEEQIVDLILSLDTPKRCNEIAKIVNPYGYGQGLDHDIEYMHGDMISNIQNEGSYWIKEVVDELVKTGDIEGMIFETTPEMPAIHLYDQGEVMNLIGFESKKEILELRERY